MSVKNLHTFHKDNVLVWQNSDNNVVQCIKIQSTVCPVDNNLLN